MDDKLHAINEDYSRPFKWGYFCAWSGMLGYGANAAYLSVSGLLDNTGQSNFLQIIASLFLAASLINLFAIRRNRWAWIVAIVLQLNPALWIVNGIYVWNRWAEMAPNQRPNKHSEKLSV